MQGWTKHYKNECTEVQNPHSNGHLLRRLHVEIWRFLCGQATIELVTLPLAHAREVKREREGSYTLKKKFKCCGPVKVFEEKNRLSRVGLELTIFCLQGRAIHYTVVAVALNCIVLLLGHTMVHILKAESENQIAARTVSRFFLLYMKM